MKSSWVLSEEERFRRFRKHREKVQQQQNSGNGSSPPNDGYYDERNSGDESYDDRMSNHYSPDREHERKYRYASGSPSYLTPPPLSPLSAHPDAQAVVAAAAAAQVNKSLLTLKFAPDNDKLNKWLVRWIYFGQSEKLKYLATNFEHLFSIWRNFEPT